MEIKISSIFYVCRNCLTYVYYMFTLWLLIYLYLLYGYKILIYFSIRIDIYIKYIVISLSILIDSHPMYINLFGLQTMVVEIIYDFE